MALEKKEGKLLVPLEGKAAGMDFELVKVRDDLFLLLGGGKDYSKLDEKIFSMIRTKPLASLVEDQFEKSLNKEELERLKQLEKEGMVEKFKLSDKYKKAVYRIKRKPAEEKKETPQLKSHEEQVVEETEKKEIPHNSSELDRKGFIVAKNEFFVKNLCEKFAEQIKKNELKGIKGFDDTFYIIKRDVYDKERQKILRFLKERKGAESAELSKELKMDSELVKGVCEFLKDEGEVMEKRKGLYYFIE